MTSDESHVGAPLEPGTLIGAYRVEARLGEGGMGVIFRAFDTKLGRPVAIKFLSSQLADAEARRRFQREAQLASSLNHPHILTIYDVGEFGGRQYLVSELVDGGTLNDWAARVRPSWRQTVDLLVGVADGLAVAHEAGILHRDVKPGNVLVSKSGYAKLADFGIAKLAAPIGRSGTETVTPGDTQWGAVIGTPDYMSPEQASGKPVDARSDVFSFGVLLHVFLTGRNPFTFRGEPKNAQSTGPVTAASLDAKIPLALRMAVEKALETDPADRYQTMRELVVDLRRVARRRTEDSGEIAAPIARRRIGPLQQWATIVAVAFVAIVAGAVVGNTWLWNPQSRALTQSTRFQRITDFVGVEETPAVSPDGRTVAFTASVDGRRQVWLRLIAGGAPLQLTGDDVDHEHPRWAPDSSSLIYFVAPENAGDAGTLWEVSALGGAPRRVAPSLGGADISHDGRRVAAFQTDGAETVLAILDRNGARTEPVRRVPAYFQYSTPRWSPDDGAIAFATNEGGFSRAIVVLTIAGGEPKTLARAANIQGFTWIPDGSGLVYASSAGSTLAYPPIFNLRAVSRNGDGERPLTVGDVSYVEPDMARPGMLVAGRIREQSDIWRFPVSGSAAENVERAMRVTRQTGQVRTPSVSPDGQRVAYLSDSGGHSNVWIVGVDGTDGRQITNERATGVTIGIPVWSPTDGQIVFVRSEAGVTSEWVVESDGSGSRELVSEAVAADWSADGRSLYFHTARGQDEEECIIKIPVDGGPSATVRCEGVNPAISHDGSVLYFSPSSGRQNEVFKATPEDGPAQPLASYAASRIPSVPTGYALSPDDRWLAVPLKDRGTTNIWAIPTDGGPFRQLTDFGSRPTLITRQVSWSPDGKFIYAALLEIDTDVVLLEGLL